MDIQRLKFLRQKKNYSQEEMAKYLGIARTTYASYEQGKREPDNATLVKLSSFFGVSTDDLLGNDIPDWATERDVLDLEEMLNSNVNMAYGGEHLTEEEKQRVKDVLTGIFWEKLQEKKRE